MFAEGPGLSVRTGVLVIDAAVLVDKGKEVVVLIDVDARLLAAHGVRDGLGGIGLGIVQIDDPGAPGGGHDDHGPVRGVIVEDPEVVLLSGHAGRRLGGGDDRRGARGGQGRNGQAQGIAHGQRELVGRGQIGGMLKALGLHVVQGIVLVMLRHAHALCPGLQTVRVTEDLHLQVQAAGLSPLVAGGRHQQRSGDGTAVAGTDIAPIRSVVQVEDTVLFLRVGAGVEKREPLFLRDAQLCRGDVQHTVGGRAGSGVDAVLILELDIHILRRHAAPVAHLEVHLQDGVAVFIHTLTGQVEALKAQLRLLLHHQGPGGVPIRVGIQRGGLEGAFGIRRILADGEIEYASGLEIPVQLHRSVQRHGLAGPDVLRYRPAPQFHRPGAARGLDHELHRDFVRLAAADRRVAGVGKGKGGV